MTKMYHLKAAHFITNCCIERMKDFIYSVDANELPFESSYHFGHPDYLKYKCKILSEIITSTKLFSRLLALNIKNKETKTYASDCFNFLEEIHEMGNPPKELWLLTPLFDYIIESADLNRCQVNLFMCYSVYPLENKIKEYKKALEIQNTLYDGYKYRSCFQ